MKNQRLKNTVDNNFLYFFQVTVQGKLAIKKRNLDIIVNHKEINYE